MIKKHLTMIAIITLFLLVACQNNNENTTENNDDSVTVDKNDDEAISLPSNILKKGDENEEVSNLQQVLIEIGYPIEQTGYFNELTTWAITDLQLQFDNIHVSGIYDQDTKDQIEGILNNEQSISVNAKLEQPEEPDTFTQTIENPYDVLALVNKSYSLPDGYEPFDLVVPDVRFPFDEDDPKKQLRQIAADALEELFKASDEAGVELYAQSGFRSFERQEAIFATNVERHGEEKANTYSARPGESEHQTGLVMDVTSRAIGFTLEIEFEDTEEGKWVRDNAHKYGFIIRYPEGKESITQYQYEPWHLRYVGIEAATDIYNENLTLEQYLGES